MVYTDGIHMTADSIEELHLFAKGIGLHVCWYENKKGKNHPHYDLRINPVARQLLKESAVAQGAQLVSKRGYAVQVATLRKTSWLKNK